MFFQIPSEMNMPYPISSEDFIGVPPFKTNVVPGIFELVVDNKIWEKTSEPVIFEVTNQDKWCSVCIF